MLAAVTVAPGMGAPCGSVTVPVMEPYRVCAEAGSGAIRAPTIASASTAFIVKRVSGAIRESPRL